MTEWDDHKARIRRFLRDPDGNLWADAYLLNLWNSETHTIENEYGLLQKVRVVRIPGTFWHAYMHDHEWAHTDHDDGEVFQCFAYWDREDYVFTHIWEPQHLEDLTPTTSALGENYTHPWEAWYCTQPAEQPPTPLPDGCHKIYFIALDKQPIYPMHLRDVQDRDQSYRQRSGETEWYYRGNELENYLYLYPRPSSVEWQDDEIRKGRPDSAEYAETGKIDVDDNLIVVYDFEAEELTETERTDPQLPEYLQKYVMHGVLARAYRANTDGRIRSLAEYWAMRRKADSIAIEAYRTKRRIDRHYGLVTRTGEPQRIRRHPRLPDEYPAVYP